MSDLIVRQACEHGEYRRHWWFEGELSERMECAGGREMVLREKWFNDLPYAVYVEVDE